MAADLRHMNTICWPEWWQCIDSRGGAKIGTGRQHWRRASDALHPIKKALRYPVLAIWRPRNEKLSVRDILIWWSERNYSRIARSCHRVNAVVDNSVIIAQPPSVPHFFGLSLGFFIPVSSCCCDLFPFFLRRIKRIVATASAQFLCVDEGGMRYIIDIFLFVACWFLHAFRVLQAMHDMRALNITY